MSIQGKFEKLFMMPRMDVNDGDGPVFFFTEKTITFTNGIGAIDELVLPFPAKHVKQVICSINSATGIVINNWTTGTGANMIDIDLVMFAAADGTVLASGDGDAAKAVSISVRAERSEIL